MELTTTSKQKVVFKPNMWNIAKVIEITEIGRFDMGIITIRPEHNLYDIERTLLDIGCNPRNCKVCIIDW